ncbi:MAG: Cobalamin import ATP-binding protein BtuD [Candidatus Methanofastidiosum methylothiophilum]|jgi:zinc transport system ATP-binding protein|uniref:Cobalamin import ATP-binding protein BtuD n=1 Tax=Candidatus Methanofastidiosum methylothiophilum TaxID=1705564 RepID=A0A150JHU6_9EURY|nr:MAG: Cobalamin import ATP-binding protein BtuD [Candidatus Methanofastidiosum methylthiophilus]MBP6932146.1 ABC transporter ATP-binding protein [Methanofastidiosum sp.]OQC52353.1 MAG: Cobalamin import ATP-binding protein BtuD [Euryarchaeota archaeon ADurb.Bin023]KYC56751.1 MAG: Cobalamin import ATP-binding protein BtuD [Candidatus Methanofastidiosum methylthiophilus]KYC57843.1 MAG: Cobalamin import ATP-binding protein BtuD [Candidatus Methanofastidiosum methylthiophilus]
MKNEIIKIENLSFDYGDHRVLENINLNIYNDDFIGIIGPNGSGKSTLLKIILGLLTPTEGRVFLFNKSPKEGRKYVGYVPQYAHIDRNFPISVGQVVLSGRIGHTDFLRRYSKIDMDIAENAMKIMGISDLKNTQIGKLSGGQFQRTLIARALSTEPKLLLLDEPTANIDIQAETNFYDFLHKLSEKMAIVLVTHDTGAISSHVKTICCINKTLYYHGEKSISLDVFEKLYGCPVELIGHGIPHRVLKEHED